MAETVAGGVYEDAPNAGTYHDANGKPVSKEVVAEHLKLVDERNKKAQALEDQAMRQQAAQLANVRNLLGVAPVQQATRLPQQPTIPKPAATEQQEAKQRS